MSTEAADIRGVDFHCHVDLHRRPTDLIAACESGRILTLAVTTTPRAFAQNLKWTAASRYVYAAVGLHPELVGERASELPLLEDLIAENRLVGEIGLDGSPQYRKSWNDQQRVFVCAIRRAQEAGGRVVSIHSRRAADDVVGLLTEHTTPDRLLPILHWFSGSWQAAARALDHGCYFSINQRMLEHRSGVDLVLKLPMSRILTETDSPFTSFEGGPSKPSDTQTTIRNLAVLRGVGPDEAHETFVNNARDVLRFADIEM